MPSTAGATVSRTAFTVERSRRAFQLTRIVDLPNLTKCTNDGGTSWAGT